MKKLKTLCNRLFSPPLWLTVLLAVLSAAGLTAVFVLGLDEHPLAYAVYVLSAYALTACCLALVKAAPGMRRAVRQTVYAHPVSSQYMTDAAFRVRISLYISLTINLVYSALKLVSGILYSSLWLGAVAVYYILLSVMRFILLRYMRTEKEGRDILQEYRQYRTCGAVMLVLNLSLTGIVFHMVWQNESFSYPGTLIFAAAAYTFYTVTVSVIDLVRYRKYESPVLSAAKAIRFAAALVSLLSLETAMLARFGSDEHYHLWMTGLTGAGVCLIVLVMSVYMLCRSGREIRIRKTTA